MYLRTFETVRDLMETEVDVLVRQEGCVDAHGREVTAMFEQRYPEAMADYRRQAPQDDSRAGRVYLSKLAGPGRPFYVLHFPVLDSWHRRPRLDLLVDQIEDGLRQLREVGAVSVGWVASCAAGLTDGHIRGMILEAAKELNMRIDLVDHGVPV